MSLFENRRERTGKDAVHYFIICKATLPLPLQLSLSIDYRHLFSLTIEIRTREIYAGIIQLLDSVDSIAMTE